MIVAINTTQNGGADMSKWDDFKKTLGNFADKTVSKTRELTDTASLKIKIANKEADRDIEYKKLGKLTYAKLKSTEKHSAEELTKKISETLDSLDKIIAELEALKAQDDERKAEKEAKKAEKSAFYESGDDSSDELNTNTIDDLEPTESEDGSDTPSA